MTTNYERIKNMTVEQMVNWFTDVDEDPECLGCKMCLYGAKSKDEEGKFKFIQCCDETFNCTEGIKQWLQAESEE